MQYIILKLSWCYTCFKTCRMECNSSFLIINLFILSNPIIKRQIKQLKRWSKYMKSCRQAMFFAAGLMPHIKASVGCDISNRLSYHIKSDHIKSDHITSVVYEMHSNVKLTFCHSCLEVRSSTDWKSPWPNFENVLCVSDATAASSTGNHGFVASLWLWCLRILPTGKRELIDLEEKHLWFEVDKMDIWNFSITIG